MYNYVRNIHTHTHTHKPGSVRAHRTEGVTGSEGREKMCRVGGRIGGEGVIVHGNAAGNGDVNGDGDRTGAGRERE